MSTLTREGTSITGLASLPRVNLLPPEIHVRRRLRRLKVQLGGAGMLAVLIVVALFVLANASVSAAKADLTSAQTQHAGFQNEVDGLAHVQATYAQVDQARSLLADAGGSEVLWSTYLGDIGPRLPAGAWLTTVKVTTATGAAASTPAAAAAVAAAAPQGVAEITFEGTALSHVNVASWLDSIAKESGWTNPYFSKSEEKLINGRKTYTFSSTVTVTTAALSGRHTKPAGS